MQDKVKKSVEKARASMSETVVYIAKSKFSLGVETDAAQEAHDHAKKACLTLDRLLDSLNKLEKLQKGSDDS